MVPGIITGITAYVISTLIASGMIPENSFLILIPVMLLIMIIELYRKQDKPFDSLAHTFFSVLYTAVPFQCSLLQHFHSTGLNSLLPHEGLIFSPGIIIGFFFLSGQMIQVLICQGCHSEGTSCMERISPKKTWEGFFGGMIIAALVAWFLSGWLGVVDNIHWVIISVIISVAGTYGDLIESMLKRSTGVKDSGTIMPGHGGFLDRFDSTIISFPLVYLFISLFG